MQALILPCLTVLDTFPDRVDLDYRIAKDRGFLCQETEAQGNGSVLGRHNPNTLALDALRFHHRALWHIRPLWRLLCNYRVFRRQYSSGWTVHSDGAE